MNLFDWSQGLPDKNWLGSTKLIGNYVAPKGDSGADQLSIAPGAGRQGGDCLLVTSPDARAGLPGFWVMRGRGNGKGIVGNLSTNEGYLAGGQRANRLSFWVRFDEGFRATSSATSKQNINVGTYHYDPAKKGVRKESDGWHFYHQLVLRHDLANGRWIQVVLNDVPQHIRGRSQYPPPPNPTHRAGNYWELLTRFYFDCVPYMSDAQIPHPVRMWVDGISLDYVPPRDGVSVTITPPSRPVTAGQTTTMRVEIVNTTRAPIVGQIGHRSYYSWTPNLVDAISGKAVHKATVTLAPGSNEYQLLLTPRAGAPRGLTLSHAVVFVPQSQLTPRNASHADAAVELDPYFGVNGPCDAQVASDQIRLTLE